MRAEIYKAAMNGDASILSGGGPATTMSMLRCLTPEKNNIIHVAAKHGKTDFISHACNVEELLDLIKQQNLQGDTPLHVAARHGHEDAAAHLVAKAGDGKERDYYLVMQNKEVDTPLHVALKYCNVNLAAQLLQSGPQALSVLNHSKQTPLHLLIRCLPSNARGKSQPTISSTHIGMLNPKGVSSSLVSQFIMYPEKLEYILRQFLSSCADAASVRAEEQGLTPLLIAADLGLLRVLKVILDCCPESVEAYDFKGRTMLHYCLHHLQYEELQELLKIPEIHALKDVKDCDGNTPAHLAAQNGDLLLLKVLHESLANFSLKNNKGISVDELIEPHRSSLCKMEEALFTTTEKKWMKPKLYRAAAKEGDVSIFKGKATNHNKVKKNKKGEDFFRSRTPNGSTILHLAVHNGHSAFVKETLQHFPSLIFSTDFNGDTAVHIVARLKKPEAEVMLQSCAGCYAKLHGDNKHNSLEYFHDSLWKVKNNNGYTALQEAIRAGNCNIASDLLAIEPSVCLETDKNGENPLHTFARYGTYSLYDELRIVRNMLKSYSSLACMKDKDGLIPSVRAVQCGRIRVATVILIDCPWSRTMRDNAGRTILHHLTIDVHPALVDESDNIARLAEEMICIIDDEIDSLRSVQDNDGNTPLHLAIKKGNLATAEFLMRVCLESEVTDELTLMDNDGNSVCDLLASEAHKFDQLLSTTALERKAILCKKHVIQERIIMVKKMDKELHLAAVNGDVKIFNQQKADIEEGGGDKVDSSYFLSRTPNGSNILHLALAPGKKDASAFCLEALKRFPGLINQTDSNGDTPLHLAAKWDTPASEKLLVYLQELYEKQETSDKDEEDDNKNSSDEEKEEEGLDFMYLLNIKNSMGNMPIHEAFCANNGGAMAIFLNIDDEGASSVNGAGETPLHLFARCGHYPVEAFYEKDGLVDDLIANNIDIGYMRDCDGMTPLLRAAKCGRTMVVLNILKHCPQAAQLRDPKGRSFLHLMRFTGIEFTEDSSDRFFKIIVDKLFEIPGVEYLRFVQDYDGNTPLHYTLKTENTIAAKMLAWKCFETDERPELLMVNNENERVLDIIANKQNTPKEIVNWLMKKERKLNTSWFQSSYGIRKEEIKESASSLSVIAALLVTITFAAAFQVPGGFDNNNGGAPVLLEKEAFQVFLLSDALAMCGSMVVLFSLLWVMAAGKIGDSFRLLDLSIFLLQLSFYATLVAFMTGVYVATAHKTLWLAIFVCAICSVVIIIALKTSLLLLLKAFKYTSHILFNLRTHYWRDLWELRNNFSKK